MKALRKIVAHVPFLNRQFGGVISSQGMISKRQIRAYVGKPSPTILEIGCNDGTHTLWFLDIFQKPDIYCFEPEPRAISRFNSKIGDRPNVKLFEIALSDRNGQITFHQSGGRKPDEQEHEVRPEGWDFSGSIRKPKDHLVKHPWVTFDKSITVETSTLDTWFENSGIELIDFIWMDVQGAEKDVFQGARKTLSKTRYIYTEYDDAELYEGQSTLEQILQQLDQFELVTQYPNDVLLRNIRLERATKAA